MRKLMLFLLMSMHSAMSIANGLEAIVISKEDMAGKMFDGVLVKDFFGNKAQSVSSFKSEDGKYRFGAFRWTVEAEENATYKYESFHHNELMYFLEGGMTLVDDDGKVTKADTGEVIFIPKGWSGTRTMFNAMKLAVVYTGEAADDHEAMSISKDQLAGKIFKDIPSQYFHGNDTQFVRVYGSPDSQFSFTVFRWTVENEENGIIEFDNYPVDEFMYFLEGGMKVIDESGRTTEAGPGEVLFIPKGWSGTHYTRDMKKLAVVYGTFPEK